MAFDMIIHGGRLIDGTGNPWFWGDLAVRGGRIAAIAAPGSGLARADAKRTLDARGLVICPGFVDIHEHSDASALINPRLESSIHQGITTICLGNCGDSLYPGVEAPMGGLFPDVAPGEAPRRFPGAAAFLAALDAQGTSCNLASLVGHGAVRAAVMGFADRPPTEEELAEMRRLVAEAMTEGAFGLSSGLEYAPGIYADTAELAALAEVAARYGGIYATHARSGYIPAAAEAIEIGRQTGAAVQISHVESHYPVWGETERVLAMIDEARRQGVDVTCDVPPYLYAMTDMATLLPGWLQEGGWTETLSRLRQPALREHARRDVLEDSDRRQVVTTRALAMDGHWDKIKLASGNVVARYVGMTLAEIAAAREVAPYDAIMDLLVEEGQRLSIVCEAHHEGDLQAILRHPTAMIECDEFARAPYGPLSAGRPHPRAYGTFPMVFRKYVRGETRASGPTQDLPEEPGYPLLSLEEAVHKMTGLPAQRLGLQDRGLLREGQWADLVVFDPETIADRATYLAPHQYPVGIEMVLVNGEIVIEQGEHSGALPGRALRGPGARRWPTLA
jgi:N-acyl-D-amino-acid deacylase